MRSHQSCVVVPSPRGKLTWYPHTLHPCPGLCHGVGGAWQWVAVGFAGEAQASLRGGLAELLLPGCALHAAVAAPALGSGQTVPSQSCFQPCRGAEVSHSHLDVKGLRPLERRQHGGRRGL